MAFPAAELKGSIVALITPFTPGGEAIDEAALKSLVDWQIAEGTHGLVPCGTTGESPTLSHDEHIRVIRVCVEAARGRVPVIAGAGSYSTAVAVRFSREAREAGADAILSVVPYYNKPTQEGLYRHFTAIAEAAGLPVILYNIPGRSAVEISVETMVRLAKVANIAGVKDATANLARASRERHMLPRAFVRLSGEDATALGFMAHGGQGCISVTANVAPRLCSAFQNACLMGDYAAALALQDRLFPLHEALFAETSPSPAKYAVSLLGKCAPDVRLPLVPPGEATRQRVREAMIAAGVLKD